MTRTSCKTEAEYLEAWREARESYNSVVLLLQGGGALGSYQGGIYEVLDKAHFHPDWVAGISIGAINAALIAGNEPKNRIARLRTFWETATSRIDWPWMPKNEYFRSQLNSAAALNAIMTGVPGFFSPRPQPPFLLPGGSPEAISYYDTTPLKDTLERLVDFDLLNDGPVRLSVGAVNIHSGNVVYFDSNHRRIGPEHIMASGALPPGFPPVEIEGEHYWDGGMVSNTPLQYALISGVAPKTLMFQVDLFSAQGMMPRTLAEVSERSKDIQYSSRTRLNTDAYRHVQQIKSNIGVLLDKLPPEMLNDPEIHRIAKEQDTSQVNVLHLVYRRMQSDRDNKDYEFSRNSMADHWQAGLNDATRTLSHINWLDLPDMQCGLVTHDIHYDAID